MTRRLQMLASCAVFLATHAQAQSPFMFAIGGGTSVPLGDFRDATNTGWNALASVGVSTLMQPIGLRLDVAHNRFAGRVAVGTPDLAVTSATLNATYRLPMTNSPLSPYLIAGAGGYRLQCVGSGSCEADTHFGWNAGLGTRVASLGMKWFLEARFHFIDEDPSSVNYFPVTLGLVF